jgi:hypothetical protein
LLFEFSIVFEKIIDVFSCGVWGNVGIALIWDTFLNGVEHVGTVEVTAMGSWEWGWVLVKLIELRLKERSLNSMSYGNKRLKDSVV